MEARTDVLFDRVEGDFNPPADAVIHWVVYIDNGVNGEAICTKYSRNEIVTNDWGVDEKSTPEEQARLNCKECLELRHA